MHTLPIDIHTHQLPALPGEAIICCLPDTFHPQENNWYSVGIHPWQLDNHAWKEAAFKVHFKSLIHHPQVIAIGEAGLDKLASTSLLQQIEALRYQALVAETIAKPLILHLVKATTELLALKKELSPRVPWIIHGFRGKLQLALELVRHGLYLSFGANYQEEAMKQIPTNRLLLETDESNVPIADLYKKAALLRNITDKELMETVSTNIQRIFFEH